MRFTGTLITLLGLSRFGVSRSFGYEADNHIGYAQVRNFAPVDILDGNDGLEPHPDSPLSYGRPVLHVNSDGNAIEEHNARLFYLDDGKYYMFAESWACGRFSFFLPPVPGYPVNDKFTPGDYGGTCGITVHTSTDLTNWDFQTLIEPKGIPGVPTKPRLLYSAVTQKYVLWLKAGNELGFTGGLFYLTADTPLGPWSEALVASGDHLAHDFDMEMDDNGDYYIVTDAFRGIYDPLVPGKPLWDVVLQKLLPDCTGVVATNDSKVQIMQSADFQGIGLCSHNERWYITGGPTCGNCEVPIQYISAPSPLGPWSTEDGVLSPDIKEGTVIAERGCGGQNKGLNKLPTADGAQVIMLLMAGSCMPITSRLSRARIGIRLSLVTMGAWRSLRVLRAWTFRWRPKHESIRLRQLLCRTSRTVVFDATVASRRQGCSLGSSATRNRFFAFLSSKGQMTWDRRRRMGL